MARGSKRTLESERAGIKPGQHKTGLPVPYRAEKGGLEKSIMEAPEIILNQLLAELRLLVSRKGAIKRRHINSAIDFFGTQYGAFVESAKQDGPRQNGEGESEK